MKPAPKVNCDINHSIRLAPFLNRRKPTALTIWHMSTDLAGISAFAEILTEAGLLGNSECKPLQAVATADQNTDKIQYHNNKTYDNIELPLPKISTPHRDTTTLMDKSADGQSQCTCIACTSTMASSPLQPPDYVMQPKRTSTSPQNNEFEPKYRQIDLPVFGLKFKFLFMWRFSMRDRTIAKVPFPPKPATSCPSASMIIVHADSVGTKGHDLAILRCHVQARKRKALLAARIPTLAASFVCWRTCLDRLIQDHACTCHPKMQLTPSPTQFEVFFNISSHSSGVRTRAKGKKCKARSERDRRSTRDGFETPASRCIRWDERLQGRRYT